MLTEWGTMGFGGRMVKAHIRLDRDITKVVTQSAKANSRSVAAEVNYLLRLLLIKKAI